MLYLLLAVGCSLAIGMIFKHAGRRRLNRMTLLTANYAIAAVLALLLIGLGAKRTAGELAPSPGLVALGLGTGVLLIAGFFLLALATDVAGMSVATGVMRVSVVIPFLASWLVWDEVPTLAQGAGLACAGAAFFMIAAKRERASGVEREKERAGVWENGGTDVAQRHKGGGRAGRQENEKTAAVAPPPASPVEVGRAEPAKKYAQPAAGTARAFGVLALLFLAGGAVDTCMKTFDEAFAEESSRALFLLMIFGVAFLVGAATCVRQRARLRTAALAWGVLLGIVNYGSVEFILRAIRQLRGPFVFPANNISIVVGAALLGVWFWDEHLSAFNKAGLGVAALALFLLRP